MKKSGSRALFIYTIFVVFGFVSIYGIALAFIPPSSSPPTANPIETIDGSRVSGNILGNATNVTGVVGVANGGTGATTASDARTNLGLGTISTLNSPLPVANGGTGATSLSGVLIGNGTSAVTGLNGVALNDVLTWNGTAWVSQAFSGGLPSGTAGQTLRYSTSWIAASNLYNNGTNIGVGTTSIDSNYKITTSGGGIKSESVSQPAGYFSSTSGYGLLVNVGNVGIGITAPMFRTDIAVSSAGALGNALRLRNANTATGTGAAILFSNTTNNDSTGQYSSYIAGVRTNSPTNGSQALAFGTNTGGAAPIERVRIDSNGYVGIGVTVPGTALDVNGALSIRGMAAPAVSPSGQGIIYFDSTSKKFKVSENGSAYTDLVGAVPTIYTAQTIQPDGVAGKDTFYGTTYVQGGAPDAADLSIGGWGDWYYDFIEFDLTGSPTAAQTFKAELWVYGSAPYDPAIKLQRITSSWTEAGVTKLSNPTAVDYTTMPVFSSTPRWNITDITSLYKDWKNGTYPNYGVKLYPTLNGQTNGSIASSDNTNATIRPKLVIIYNLP